MRHSMGSFLKNLGREESDQVLSIYDTKQGKNQLSTSRLNENGQNRMPYKLAKEKEVEEFIDSKVQEIEARMQERLSRKQGKLKK